MRRNWFENPDHTELLASAVWSACEDRIQAFEEAWRQGQTPEIDDFVSVSDPARKELLIELICVDLEFRLKAGEPVRVQAYFEKYSELPADRRAVLELIEAEHNLRRRLGEEVRLDEYRSRFPDYFDELFESLRFDERDTRTSKGLSATTASAAPAAPAWPVVAGYELVGEIGRGGMGVVYKAREQSLGRFVALKFLPVEFARDPDLLERFIREARTASALNHPHICIVHALGEFERRPYIAMELIEGETLQAQIARRPCLDLAMRWLMQAARALAAAHAASVVHRDVKPENIMVRGDGFVKVLDFGLARRPPTFAQSDTVCTHNTDPGRIFGTVAYMSPEQARGETADSASDIFSLGIVLFELVTGRHPFQAESALGMLHAITTLEPAAPSRLNPEVSAALEGLIEAMLHKDARLRPTAVEVEKTLAALASAAPRVHAPTAPPRIIVHRELELAALCAALERADAGRGELICVAGEPGIGKTTLVEDFLESPAVAARHGLIARGQCSERLGNTEAYIPVMDALQCLLRTEASGAVVRLMKVVAPTWYFQLASAAREISPAGNSEVSKAFSQGALLREFRTLLEEVSRLGPVILFFDDVHWADVSTVDLIAHLGRHCRGMRVLGIVTLRPTELLLGPHPFHGIKLELQARGTCTELSLGLLARPDVDRYLSLAFPGHAFSPEFADLVHARTEGSPLFMVELLRYLRERGVIAERNGRWSLARETPDLLQELPDSVRSMIRRKLERLNDDERRLLAAASVQGTEFDSAVAADALMVDAALVDERLQILDRVHGLVRPVREHLFPNRTLSLRYAFVHSLYQQSLYGELPRSRRATLAVALARSLEHHYGEGNSEAAAALACLYEVGRDFASAARQFWLAAQNAACIFAHREAVILARRGLQLLDYLPENPERDALELPLQTTLALQLQVTEGYAAPDARPAYSRARELCQRLSGPAPLFPVLWGLWLFSKVRSELHKAQEMAFELLALAQREQDPDWALQAHQAMGMTAFCRGNPAVAVRHVEHATALYDPQRHRTHSFSFGQDPSVICKSFGAVGLWLLGYPDQAERQSDETVRFSRELSPSSQAVALHFAAMLHQLRRDGRRTSEFATAAGVLAAEHGFSFWRAGANVLGGWAAATSGKAEEGAEQLRRGLRDWMATDSVTYQTYYLGLLAEVLAALGQMREPLRLLEEALALVEQTGERLFEAELYRLRGEVVRSAGGHSEAEASFQKALDIARRQEANSLELRASMSLARLFRDQGQPKQGLDPLRDAFAHFSEGWQTPDLRESRELLAELA